MSIVNFEENMKTTERLSDTIFALINRMNIAKNTGTLQGDELSKIEILEGKLFANLVARGKKTEEEVEGFENLMPRTNMFNNNHEGLEFAYETNKQANAAALFDRENRFAKAKTM